MPSNAVPSNAVPSNAVPSNAVPIDPRSTFDFDVVVIGSLNLDLVARTPRLPEPGETVIGSTFVEVAGGKGLNQAVAAARSGASVALIGAVGDDDAGEVLRRVVLDEGIDDRWLVTLEGVSTGRALITVDDDAENVIVVIPGANTRIDETHANSWPCGRVTLAQLEIPMASVIAAFATAREEASITILNPAPATDLPDELLDLCEFVIPNEHELALVGGPASILANGPRAVIVTQGGDGADIVDTGGTRHLPAYPVEPVDTTGAGDAFCGAFAARLAAGASLLEAADFAMAAGALATTAPGAVPSLPRRSAIERFLNR